MATAVDMALKNSPRVHVAEDDVTKANAQLSQTHDVYIPSVTVGAGIGQSYGYSTNPPTLFTANGGSLVYNASQLDYIRSARSGVNAAHLALEETREAVAEDTALCYAALDHDQQREAVIRQQVDYTGALVRIVQERLDAGRDTAIDLTQAKLSAARLRQALLHAQDNTAVDRDRLAHLLGVSPAAVRVDGSSFSIATLPSNPVASDGYLTPAVAAAFANAKAKQYQAFGDKRYLYRPQVSLVAQYNYYATFTDSFHKIQNLNPTDKIGANEGVFGVQITIPFYDKLHQAKARESAADASHAFHEAQNAQFLSIDGQSRLRHSIDELKANAEVAALEQQLSQQQLEVLRIQLHGAPNPNGPQMTPKDEQNALIGEREKYLTVVDAAYQLRQAQINLLRQTGGLTPWLKTLTVPTTP